MAFVFFGSKDRRSRHTVSVCLQWNIDKLYSSEADYR